jgi:hypothetical protein
LTGTNGVDTPLAAGQARRRSATEDALEQRVRGLPGVRMASIATSSPLGSGPSVFIGRRDRPAPPPGDQARALFRSIGPEYFRTLGIRMQRGREFSSVDVPGASYRRHQYDPGYHAVRSQRGSDRQDSPWS